MMPSRADAILIVGEDDSLHTAAHVLACAGFAVRALADAGAALGALLAGARPALIVVSFLSVEQIPWPLLTVLERPPYAAIRVAVLVDDDDAAELDASLHTLRPGDVPALVTLARRCAAPAAGP